MKLRASIGPTPGILRRTAVIGGATAIVVVGAGSVLAASAPITLYACYDAYGNVRITDLNTCRLPGGGRLVPINAAGVPGPQGDTGVPGPIGPQGIPGPQGAQGPQGVPGAQGPAGATGQTGVTGAQGPAGATGLQGVQGIQGVQGNTGQTGVTGAQGPAGATGLTGLTGAAGPQGATGLTGLTGAQGVQGNTGQTGATGAQGVQGNTGAAGGSTRTVNTYATSQTLTTANQVVLCAPASGTAAMTLPAASGNAGVIIVIKKTTTTGTCTVSPIAAVDNDVAGTTFTMSNPANGGGGSTTGNIAEVISNGTVWYLLNQH